ncbi:MAG: outer membrane protein assembly factor BamD [Desulfarculaceae bacterium]|nr:outer membrane protein assembly factor BamD [Desulfarculaceae bacterium]
MTKKFRLAVLGLLLVLLAAGGCGWFGGQKSATDDAFDTPAQVLANEAETLYREGQYDESANLFQALKDRFPYSRFALLADLRVGDAYFKSKRYEEAVLAYEDFIRLHPKNDAVPYAIYQMGMVYFDQMLTPDRDPENARKAMQTFQRLIKQYPQSEWAVRCQPRLQEATRRLAAHDMVVGKYYFQTKSYRAAMGRFKRVLTQYPDVGLYNEAMNYLRQAQEKWSALPAKEREGQGIDRRDLTTPIPGVEAPDVLTGPEASPL